MLESFSISDLLGFASIGCWLGAQFPQVIENLRRQSCEGLALPFLANWLLGDISNLIGCILTHQLAFQRWLATYFVIVDCMLVAQFIYYYKAPKSLPSIHPHIRSATTPLPGRRMSIDRGASRYRTLSVVASNVAAAAALAAQQDEQEHPGRYPYRSRRRAGSTSIVRTANQEEEEEGDIPPAMFESFRSEGGRNTAPKRVSWSIERHGGRAASVGPGRAVAPTPLNLLSNDALAASQNPATSELSSNREVHSIIDSVESPLVSSRGTKASRKGSTMVFLGAWALFGIGALTSSHRSMPSSSITNVGRVLSSGYFQNSVPVALSKPELYIREPGAEEFEALDLGLPGLDSEDDPEDEPPSGYPHREEPSGQQVLGRIFAWMCTTLYLTSRLPQIWKNYVRKSVEGLSMYLFIFAFLGNTFYVASILASPRRLLPPPQSTEFIRESIPYLLGSGGTLLFDITIVSQSVCYRPRRRHTNPSYIRIQDEEEAGLLSGDPLSTHPPSDSAIINRGRTSRTQSVA